MWDGIKYTMMLREKYADTTRRAGAKRGRARLGERGCACVCERERERKRGVETERERTGAQSRGPFVNQST